VAENQADTIRDKEDFGVGRASYTKVRILESLELESRFAPGVVVGLNVP
jgi:hypothetical protein